MTKDKDWTHMTRDKDVHRSSISKESHLQAENMKKVHISDLATGAACTICIAVAIYVHPRHG